MRFRVLESWRGVAAILVAMFHLNVLSPIYSLEFIRNAYLFVDFFFVLSGFVITHSYGDRMGTLDGVGVFALRRFSRLWPLHAVVLLAFVVVESGKAFMAARGATFYAPPFSGSTSPNAVLMHLGFAQAMGIQDHLTWNPPSWSIAAEFWTYMIFAATLHVAATRFSRLRFAAEAFLFILLIGSVAVLLRYSDRGMDVTFDLGIFRCICGFLIGHFVYRLWQICPRDIFDAPSVEIAVLIAVIGYVSVAGRSGYSFFAPLVFAVVVLVFAFEAGPVSKLMSNRGNEWLGRISYSIYMWQAFIIFNLVDRPVSIVEKITHRALTATDAGSALGGEAGKLIVLGGHLMPLLVTALYLGVLVIVAGISYRWIEKPGQRWFRAALAAREQAETA